MAEILLPPFWVQQQDGARETEAFQTITTSPQHRNLSQEELRWTVYAGNHSSDDSSPARNDGLAFAKLPHTINTFTSPGRRAGVTQGPRLGSQIITFRVGTSEPQDYVIHSSLILPRSQVVSAAMSRDWMESQTRTFPLPETTPEVFEVYQQWLYTDYLFTSSASDALQYSTEYARQVQCYLLGQTLLDADFKDAILDSIVQRLLSTATFDTKLTNLIYENTPAKSTLRCLWVEIYAWCGDAGWLDEDAAGNCVNGDFAVELSKRQMELRAKPGLVAPFGRDTGCRYHEHVGGWCYAASAHRVRNWAQTRKQAV